MRLIPKHLKVLLHLEEEDVEEEVVVQLSVGSLRI